MGEMKDYSLNVSNWPEALGSRESGFMGVFYYNGQGIIDTVQSMFSPIGIFMLLSVPLTIIVKIALEQSPGGRSIAVLLSDLSK